MFGISVADVNRESGINVVTDKTYLVDGIHLTAQGGEIVSDIIYNKIVNTPYFR